MIRLQWYACNANQRKIGCWCKHKLCVYAQLIQKKRNEKPEVRKASREAALRCTSMNHQPDISPILVVLTVYWLVPESSITIFQTEYVFQ